MYIFYSREDAGAAMVGPAAPWGQQELVILRYHRVGTTAEVKQASDSIGDNGPGTVYKHHVPFTRILRQIENRITGRTRAQALVYLNGALNLLGIAHRTVADATRSRYEFDVWVEEAINLLVDYPDNIFTGPSTGDHAGTTLDHPTGTHVHVEALKDRLAIARAGLYAATGVSIDETVSLADVVMGT